MLFDEWDGWEERYHTALLLRMNEPWGIRNADTLLKRALFVFLVWCECVFAVG